MEINNNEKVVAGYICTSCENNECVSYEAEQIICYALAESGGSTTVTLYVDRGFSTETSERPAYQALLTDIASGCIGEVLVTEMDTLSSDTAAYEEILLLAQTGGTTITTVQ